MTISVLSLHSKANFSCAINSISSSNWTVICLFYQSLQGTFSILMSIHLILTTNLQLNFLGVALNYFVTSHRYNPLQLALALILKLGDVSQSYHIFLTTHLKFFPIAGFPISILLSPSYLQI